MKQTEEQKRKEKKRELKGAYWKSTNKPPTIIFVQVAVPSRTG